MPEQRTSEQTPKRRRGADQNRRRPQSPPRDKKITIKLSQQEYADVREAAHRPHWAVRAFVAHTVMSEAKGIRQPGHAELRVLLEELMHVGGQVRQLSVNLNQAITELGSGELTQQLAAHAHACAQVVDKVDRVADEICRHLP